MNHFKNFRLNLIRKYIIHARTNLKTGFTLIELLTSEAGQARIKPRSGFTLIELLMIMAVIGVLAGVLFVLINPAEMARRSRDAKRLGDLGIIKQSVDLALADGEELQDTAGWVSVGNDNNNFAGMTGFDVGKYLPVIPQEPINQSVHILSDCSASTDANPRSYQFNSVGGVYALRLQFESVTNCTKLNEDGNPSDYYELGTDPTL